MADVISNIAKGAFAHWWRTVINGAPLAAADPALIVYLLVAAESDDDLDNRETLAAVLGAAGNTEATFSGYQRFTLRAAELSGFDPVVDHSATLVRVDLPDQLYAAAAAGQTVVKIGVAYQPDATSGSDATAVPVVHLDESEATNGFDMNLIFGANGVAIAS